MAFITIPLQVIITKLVAAIEGKKFGVNSDMIHLLEFIYTIIIISFYTNLTLNINFFHFPTKPHQNEF